MERVKGAVQSGDRCCNGVTPLLSGHPLQKHKCRKKDSVKRLKTTNAEPADVHTFSFKVSFDNVCDVNMCKDNLLVDCGATAHIVTNKSKFISFDDSFIPDKHFIELADGSRTNGIVNARGKASISLHDTKNNLHNVILENALYIPSFKQDIFSVQAATEKGVSSIWS